jgi:hypothetical protein
VSLRSLFTGSHGPPEAGKTCGQCAHFRTAPAIIEAVLPGLRSMGSALASVRGADGICAVHDAVMPRHAGCKHFEMTSRGCHRATDPVARHRD